MDTIKYLKCCQCGDKIETVPMTCGYDIIFDEKTNQWECNMGSEFGYMKLDELICSKCQEKQCY